MKKTLLLTSTLLLGLAIATPAHALGHTGGHAGHAGGHAGHVSGHAGHVSGHTSDHTGHIGSRTGHVNGHTGHANNSKASHASGHTGHANNSKAGHDSNLSNRKSSKAKSSYSIQKHYTDNEASRIFKANKIKESDQKAYRKQAIFNNPWIWMTFLSHHRSHIKNADYTKGYRDGWAEGEKTKANYKEPKTVSHQSKAYRDGLRAGYQDAQKKVN